MRFASLPSLFRPAALRLRRLVACAGLVGAPLLAQGDPLAPPRGFFGPGPGDASQGGPGDTGDLSVTDSASWTRWWAFNRESYLVAGRGLDRAVLDPVALDPAAAPRLVSPWRPGDAELYRGAVVEILNRLDSTRDLDIQRASLLALGKIGPPPTGVVMPEGVQAPLKALRDQLKNRNEAVQNAAVLGIGVHGGIAATALLASIALDEKPGRAALGRSGRIDRRTRAFAAHALGLAGRTSGRVVERRFVVRRLLELLEQDGDDTDLATAAILGLGHCPLPVATPAGAELVHRGAVHDALLAYLRSGKSDLRARSQVPVALARQAYWPAQPTADAHASLLALRLSLLTELTGMVGPRAKTHPLLREGVVQALGLLAGAVHGDARRSGPDKAALEVLDWVAREGQEREAGLAMIALARAAARGPVPEDPVTVDVRGDLGTLAAEGQPSRRPWALLALGVLAHERGQLGAAPALGTLALIRRRLERAPTPEERAAAGMALGLAGDGEASRALIDRLDEGDFKIRGLFALSLALLPDRDAIPELAKIARSNIYRPFLVRDVATALGVLGYEGLSQLLVGKLVSARFMPEKVAALQALAWSSEPGAVPALRAVVTRKRIDRRRIDDTSRAFAIAAIGAIASRDPFPFNGPWAADVVWAAAPPSLHDDERGGGVLDLF